MIDDAQSAYDHAPCGLLSTTMDGRIVQANVTLLDWLGLDEDAVVGRLRFTDLLSIGGKLYHETHLAPLLRLHGEFSGLALELRTSDGTRIPVLVSATVVRDGDEPVLVRTTIFDAQIRRAYEEELLRERQAAVEARRQAETDRARLQDVLAVLQRSLLPESLPQMPGIDTATYYHTASPDELGGDFYDVFALDDGRWSFFLGDVCGKGPAAAAVTSLARYTLRTAALYDPAAALPTLNSVLYERFAGGDPRYCTAIFGTLRREAGEITAELASGGHPPPLLVRADGTTEFVEGSDGTLIGILPSSEFPLTEVTLGAGDLLLLYTDGLIEARAAGSRILFDLEELQDLARGYAGQSPEALVSALTGTIAGFGPHLADDVALLALGISPPPA